MADSQTGNGPDRRQGVGRPPQSPSASSANRAPIPGSLAALLLESTEDGVYAVDLQGRCTFVNPAGARMLGYEPHALVGRHMHPLVHHTRADGSAYPEDECPTTLTMQDAISRRTDADRLWRHDGTPLPVDYSVSAVVEDERVVGAVVVFRDVSERQRASEELRASEERLAGIVASAMDAIITVDPDQKIVVFNHAAEEILRVSAADAIGRDVNSFLPERFRRAHRRHIGAFGTTGVTSRTMQSLQPLVARRADGEEFPIEATISQTEVGGQKLYTVILRDITERRAAEEALARDQAHIEALNERLQRAMTETHHRVKNNLQIIAAMVDLQLMEGTVAIRSDELRRLGAYVRTLAAVHEVLTHEAKGDAQAESVSARDVLGRLLSLMQETAPNRRIVFNIEDVRLAARHGTSLALVVNELVSNAVKHAHEEVSVLLRRRRHRVALEVRDDGVGFPPGFDPLAAATTGLELVENLARLDLGGETAYVNRTDGGACVCVSFPIAARKDISPIPS